MHELHILLDGALELLAPSSTLLPQDSSHGSTLMYSTSGNTDVQSTSVQPHSMSSMGSMGAGHTVITPDTLTHPTLAEKVAAAEARQAMLVPPAGLGSTGGTSWTSNEGSTHYSSTVQGGVGRQAVQLGGVGSTSRGGVGGTRGRSRKRLVMAGEAFGELPFFTAGVVEEVGPCYLTLLA